MSKLDAQARLEAERDAALSALADAVPYNRFIGVRFDRLGDELTARLPYKEALIGNPFLPALHGGVTGAFLEITALMQLAWDQVWALIGQFGGEWHPLIAKVWLTGTGVGQLRTIETVDGKQIVERLDAMDNAGRLYRYSNISGIPASNYAGTLAVKPKGSGSTVEWRAQFLANDQATFIVKLIVSTLFKVGLDSLPGRFGAMK